MSRHYVLLRDRFIAALRHFFYPVLTHASNAPLVGETIERE
jgi:hypothetical protein